MPRLPSPVRRPIPWVLVLRVAREVGAQGKRRWDRLSASEQRDLVALVRRSKGRPGNLSSSERTRVRAIVRKALDWR